MRFVILGAWAGMIVGLVVGAWIGYNLGAQATWALVTHKMRRAQRQA